MNDNIPTKQFENDKDLNVFNKEFERIRVTTPNDYGYEVSDRLTKVEDYEAFNYTPYRQFSGSKHFNTDEFNKMFEYNQEKHGSTIPTEGAVIHKTTDGFYGYNTADFGNAALVSSYNGILIVGDNLGSSGVGYSDGQYSDYKKSFEAPINPDNKLNLPTEYSRKTKRSAPLSNAEMQKQLELQKKHRQLSIESTNQGPSNRNFKLQEEMLIKSQKEELRKKEEQDKQFILQFQNLYDTDMIQDALNNKLVTSYENTFYS
jgi:hypothetical protein